MNPVELPTPSGFLKILSEMLGLSIIVMIPVVSVLVGLLVIFAES